MSTVDILEIVTVAWAVAATIAFAVTLLTLWDAQRAARELDKLLAESEQKEGMLNAGYTRLARKLEDERSQSGQLRTEVKRLSSPIDENHRRVEAERDQAVMALNYIVAIARDYKGDVTSEHCNKPKVKSTRELSDGNISTTNETSDQPTSEGGPAVDDGGTGQGT